MEKYINNPERMNRVKDPLSFKYDRTTKREIAEQILKVRDFSQGSGVYLTGKQIENIAVLESRIGNLFKNMARCKEGGYSVGKDFAVAGSFIAAEALARASGTIIAYTVGKNKDKKYSLRSLSGDVTSTLIKGPLTGALFSKAVKEASDLKLLFPRLLNAFPKGFTGAIIGEGVGAGVYYFTGGAEDDYPGEALETTGVRVVYGVVWTVPSTIIKLSIYDFILGLRCVFPQMPIVMQKIKSPKVLEGVQTGIAAVTLFGYSLGTSWLFFDLRDGTMHLFGYYTETEKKARELSDKDEGENEEAEFVKDSDSLMIVTQEDE